MDISLPTDVSVVPTDVSVVPTKYLILATVACIEAALIQNKLYIPLSMTQYLLKDAYKTRTS